MRKQGYSADNNQRRSCLYLLGVAFMAGIFLIFLMAIYPLRSASDETPVSNASGKEAPVLELRVDSQARARVICSGFKIMASVGGSFEFYDRHLLGGRESIFTGPWKGALRENYPGVYSLTGIDPSTGGEYAVFYSQVDTRTIELRLSFKTPSQTSGLEFEVAKLSSDLFKGGDFVTTPDTAFDAQGIPLQPRPLMNRMLLTDKSRILVRGALCDIEIEDLSNRNTLYAADGRNVQWDKFKSIMFGARADNLSPGSRHEFGYRIRSLPPSRHVSVNSVPASTLTAGTGNAWSFFSIPPKNEIRMSGSYRLKDGDAVSGSPTGTAEAVASRGIEELTALSLPVMTLKTAPICRGISIERVSRKERPDIPPEGFEMVVTRERVTVKGADERGCLYGVYALLGRMEQADGGWGVPCGRIRDWPDLPLRGACLELYPMAIRDVSLMKRYLDAYSRARSNVVVFLHNPKHLRSWILNKDDGRWTREQMAEIARYARWLHMDVWGGMGSSFKRQDFPEMVIHERSGFYDPFEDKNYRYLFGLYDEILKTYHPSTLLISHDEIQGLAVYAEASGKSTADILASDVKRIHDRLSQSKVRTAMWGDMLLDHEAWETKVGSANSRNPLFRSGATHLALRKLPKDVFILDWHYDVKMSYESIEYFRENGFSVAGASWYDPQTAQILAGSVKRFGGQGIIATDFGFWQTMSPAATTLYAPLCGWSVHRRIDDDQRDVLALAETMRNPVHADMKLKQTPVSLRDAANRSACAAAGGKRNGLFDAGSFFDLGALQQGRIILGGIVFDVASDDGGRKDNVVVVTDSPRGKGGLTRGRSIFEGDADVRRIAFLHTAFIEEPVMDVRKLGFYKIEYENGIIETIHILDNWNITDIRSSMGLRRNTWTFLRSPDVLIGAERVWQGSSSSGIPLNLQLFLWENPYPDKKIRSIKLMADDELKGSRIALLGLTFLQ
jgi:hypothetical protein